MDEKFMITDAHSCRMPVIRIKKAVLQNFKSVNYGEITFRSPENAGADILGIYGQNGSGKTSFVEALSILKQLLSGLPVNEIYADCISLNAEYAVMTFHFDLNYPDAVSREVVYTVSLSRVRAQEENPEVGEAMTAEEDGEAAWKIRVCSETVSLAEAEDGVMHKPRKIIDTGTVRDVFTPVVNRKIMAGASVQTLQRLQLNKLLSRERSQSFLFQRDTLKILLDHDADCVFTQVLLELRHYAYTHLFVVDSRSSGLIRLNVALPLYTTKGIIMLNLHKTTTVSDHMYDKVQAHLIGISTVLSQMIPGLSIHLRQVSRTLDQKGQPASKVLLIADRGGLQLPLRDESDGVRKIISVLSLVAAAFNQEGVTVAIDEFDAGIFEYLLGELLQAMEKSARGQFVFTSHNLRPLEVINQRFICFTTTNPDNRYYRMEHVEPGDNLRDFYFRELVIGEQDEQLYNKTKRFKIVAALRKAGEQA